MDPNNHIDLYIARAERTRNPTLETVYMLGALAASAAAWGELRDAPADWEWPVATEDFNGE